MKNTLYSFLESKQTDAIINDIDVKNFNVEYYALDKDTTSDVVTAKEEVANTGGYHLRGLVHDLAKTIAQKQNGEVTITFAMTDLLRKKQYLIEIKYTHNREKGIGVFLFKANNRESKTNINTVKINQNIITPHEKELFNKLTTQAPQNFPADLFIKLLYIIYYSLKAVLKTENYSKKINAAKPVDNTAKEPTPKEGDMTTDEDQSK